jgi:hypothetical protein
VPVCVVVVVSTHLVSAFVCDTGVLPSTSMKGSNTRSDNEGSEYRGLKEVRIFQDKLERRKIQLADRHCNLTTSRLSRCD